MNRAARYLSRLTLLVGVMLSLTHCALNPPKIFVPEQQPPAREIKNPQVALVLGGGGARGFAHLGVLEVLRKNHIPIDFIAGTSAGSIVGALYCDHADIQTTKKAMMSAKMFDVMDISVIPHLSGSVTGYHMMSFVAKHTDSDYFQDLKIPLITVTTDLKSGKPFPIVAGPLAPAVKASASIPGVVEPSHLYGHVLVDGGVVDNIPVDVAREYKPKMVIAVDIGKDLDTSYVPTWSGAIVARSYAIMSRRMAKDSDQLADVLIRPHVGQVSMFDLSDKQKLVEEGRVAARNALPKICAMMTQKGVRPIPAVCASLKSPRLSKGTNEHDPSSSRAGVTPQHVV
jgi:NTE family protein